MLGCAAVAVVVAAVWMVERQTKAGGPWVVSAWTFGDRASLEVATGARALDHVDVDWLRSRPDGSLAAPQEDAAFVRAARRAGCRVFVTLTNYDPVAGHFSTAVATAILNDDALMRRHAAAVVRHCVERGYDGLNLDWEDVRAQDRTRFSRFVELLARELHQRDLLLAVDVYPKTSEPGSWSGQQAQDWRRLGRSADELRVMTYNFSGSWSGPGALMPVDWIDAVLTFGERQVDPARLRMGIGFYGRDWQGRRTTDLTWAQAERLAHEHGVVPRRDASGELTFSYQDDGETHVVVYLDRQAVATKLDVLTERHPDVGGVACWLMGQEDPRVWPLLHRRLH